MHLCHLTIYLKSQLKVFAVRVGSFAAHGTEITATLQHFGVPKEIPFLLIRNFLRNKSLKRKHVSCSCVVGHTESWKHVVVFNYMSVNWMSVSNIH